MNSLNIKKEREGGFTLLELLIVISIIAILSVALVLVLNPAEALKKSRDAQRISDLSTMKTALGLYLTSTTTPYLGAATAGALNNTNCKATPSAATGHVMYSLISTSDISDASLDNVASGVVAVQTATPATTDGAGWIPVMFDNLIGGSPISNLPLDPTNAIVSPDTAASVTNASLLYRYACSISPLAFEIDATLESDAYTVAENKRTSDGGDSSLYYEVGTNLRILGAGGTHPF